MTKQQLYKSLPNVDEVLMSPEIAELLLAGVARPVVLSAIRESLEAARAHIADGSMSDAYGVSSCVADTLPCIEYALTPSLRPVINATGIIVHTNLGRSVLADDAQSAVAAIIDGYSNVEYDISAGARGSRHDHIESLLCEICGCEAAMAVNNNAAAVLLSLASLAGGHRDTIVSRGQLVEVGGSFRIPDVMAASGTHMVEVGATNKTHLKDYRNTIEKSAEDGHGVGLLFKAHTSNYKISGFVREVGLEELVALGKEFSIPVVEDLGSGVLVDLEELNVPPVLPHEPTVAESVAAGVDIVCFSGDKLMGGPQAGIMCGKRDAIAACKKHPLARALRLDKMTLAALEATLRIYRDPKQAVMKIPTLQMLALSASECKTAAENLAIMLRSVLDAAKIDGSVQVVPDASFAGGGSLPSLEIDSYALAVSIEGMSADELEEHLRLRTEIPIIGRIKDGHYLMAVRTLSAGDVEVITAQFETLLQ